MFVLEVVSYLAIIYSLLEEICGVQAKVYEFGIVWDNAKTD